MDDSRLEVVVHCSAVSRSHMAATLMIAEELVRRGHSVKFAATEKYLRFADGYNVTRVTLGSSADGERGMRAAVRASTQATGIAQIRRNAMLASRDFLAARYDEEVVSLAPVLDSADVVLCNHLAYACMDLAKVHGVPLIIGFQPMSIMDQRKPSYLTANMNPGPVTTADLGFLARLWDVYMQYRVLQDTAIVKRLINKKRAEHGMPATATLVDETGYGLSLANTFVGLEPATPLHPTMRFIGPISPKSHRDDDSHVQDFLTQHQRTLYIAFGSLFPLTQADIALIASGARQALDGNAIDGVVWALGTTSHVDGLRSFAGDPRVLILEWAPQQQILRSPNTRAFLSHGGMSSISEALLSKTPVLGMAYIHDQPKNLAKLQAKGVGVFLARDSLTPGRLAEAIAQAVQKDTPALATMQVLAHFGQKRLDSAADMVEEHAYLAKACRPFSPYDHRNRLPPCELEHLTPAGDGMSFIKANNLDIFCAVFVMLVATLVLAARGISHLRQLANGRIPQKPNKE